MYHTIQHIYMHNLTSLIQKNSNFTSIHPYIYIHTYIHNKPSPHRIEIADLRRTLHLTMFRSPLSGHGRSGKYRADLTSSHW